ncbi:3-hydroxyisobutyrate dehydrogenase [Gemmobacter aquaticus]|uniref:3-hydroxyisobutyrate dehydrogenase n=1 Tax=Gemmobacter aquaticus TaxID=490185 RepID=A0A918DF22_9RHOB|nr:NAD(P)-dependent oxidoreductase [Gemmobacter aquaticus]GGO38556.1 3-hydroxyisobutyrate dehydrogenase [Gemmobacter aquaticus]
MTEGARVTVLGTGIMGAPMAARLADAGMTVTTWNRTAAKAAVPGTISASDAIAAVRVADVVVCMLSSGPVCDAVLLGNAGVIAAMQSGAVLVVMSSIPVETARAQAEAARACGVDYVDAPVSGGEAGAKAGTLSIMAGGDTAVVERLMPVFTALGRPTHVGPVGCGQLAKLANQLIVATTICAVAEALTLAAAGGADPGKVREALLGGFADSTILKLHGLRMVERRFAPGGPARYQLKDTSTALGLARDLGLTLPVAAQVDQLFGAMVEYGDGDLDHSAVILELARLNQRVEERA